MFDVNKLKLWIYLLVFYPFHQICYTFIMHLRHNCNTFKYYFPPDLTLQKLILSELTLGMGFENEFLYTDFTELTFCCFGGDVVC
jgi:hypothetical protein